MNNAATPEAMAGKIDIALLQAASEEVVAPCSHLATRACTSCRQDRVEAWFDTYSDLLLDAVAQRDVGIARLRQRMFGLRSVEGPHHSTACTIWGDNGQGGTAEGFPEPLPCNCGALVNAAALGIFRPPHRPTLPREGMCGEPIVADGLCGYSLPCTLHGPAPTATDEPCQRGALARTTCITLGHGSAHMPEGGSVCEAVAGALSSEPSLAPAAVTDEMLALALRAYEAKIAEYGHVGPHDVAMRAAIASALAAARVTSVAVAAPETDAERAGRGFNVIGYIRYTADHLYAEGPRAEALHDLANDLESHADFRGGAQTKPLTDEQAKERVAEVLRCWFHGTLDKRDILAGNIVAALAADAMRPSSAAVEAPAGDQDLEKIVFCAWAAATATDPYNGARIFANAILAAGYGRLPAIGDGRDAVPRNLDGEPVATRLRAWADVRDEEAVAEPTDEAKRDRTALLRAAADLIEQSGRAACASDALRLASAVTADDMRALGWAVAVHNDYRLHGEPHTFWLFTRDGCAIKGEGRTDAEALRDARAAARRLDVAGTCPRCSGGPTA